MNKAVIKPVGVDGKSYGYRFWCEGCQENHVIVTNPDQKTYWDFNGDTEKPTFSPSYLTWLDPNPKAQPEYDPTGKFRNGFRCHSFIRDGNIEYLGDCTHALAGQTIPLKLPNPTKQEGK